MKYLHNDRELLGAPRGHRTGVGKSACDGMIFSGGGGEGGHFQTGAVCAPLVRPTEREGKCFWEREQHVHRLRGSEEGVPEAQTRGRNKVSHTGPK